MGATVAARLSGRHTFASKGLGYLAALLLLLSLLACYKISCYQTTRLLTISSLADITLLKTTCHFILLLVGFDTLTYRKEIQLTPYTCGSSAGTQLRTRAGELKTEILAKEQMRSQVPKECDRLAKEPANQAEVQQLKDGEALL